MAPTSASIAVGATQQFTATAMDSSGNTISGVSFAWASSNTSVATISSSGVATGMSAGSATITATASGVTSTAAALTVTSQTSVQAVNYAPGGAAFNGISSIATDQQGDVWVANSDGSVSELPAGNYSAGARNFPAPSPGLNGPSDIAVDGSGNIWMTIPLSNSAAFSGVIELVASQAYAQLQYAPSSPSPTSQNINLNDPVGIAVDSANNIWVTNYAGNSLTELVAADNYNPSYYDSPGADFYQPFSVAVSTNDTVWAANQQGDSVSELPAGNYGSGQNYYQQSFSIGTGGQTNPTLAVDNAGNVWVANGDSVNAYVIELVASNGYQVKTWTPSGETYGCAYALTLDGGGNVWVVNYCSSTITELVAGNGYAAINYAPANSGLSAPDSIAVDSMGDVWVANTNNSVSELVQVAVPKQVP